MKKIKRMGDSEIKKLAVTIAEMVDEGVISKDNIERVIMMSDKAMSEHKNIRKMVGGYRKRLLDGVKKSSKALRTIVKLLDLFHADALGELAALMNDVGDNPRYYKRCHAEYVAKWGCENYIVNEVLNGAKLDMVSKNTKAYKAMSAAVDHAEHVAVGSGFNTHLGLHGVVRVNNGHYIAFICGGNNGRSDWVTYFRCFEDIVKSDKLEHAWLVEIKNDCCDDIHYALIGFSVK